MNTRRCWPRSIAYAACRTCPTTSALAEYGPGQYEVNLAHATGRAARLRRGPAIQARSSRAWRASIGCDATFLPKPYRDMAGSGLHIHVSLLDTSGRNIFAAASAARERAAAPRDRRHAGHARRRHGDLRAGPELLPALSSPRHTCRCIRPGPSTIAVRRCACRPPTPPTCASSIAWPARMRIRISCGVGAGRHAPRAGRASSNRRRS